MAVAFGRKREFRHLFLFGLLLTKIKKQNFLLLYNWLWNPEKEISRKKASLMSPEEQLLLEERIADSVYGQTFSERSTFNKKDLLYAIAQIKRGKLPILYTEIENLPSHTLIPLGTLVFVGGKQHTRYIKLSYSNDKELMYVNFFHENQSVGTDDIKAMTLVELAHESDGDIDTLWMLFEDLLQKLFVNYAFKAILLGQIKEEDFFDESSRLFSSALCSDRDFIDDMCAFRGNVLAMNDDLDGGIPTSDADERWMRVVRLYEKVARRIPVWKIAEV